jgi:hypothetical protein
VRRPKVVKTVVKLSIALLTVVVAYVVHQKRQYDSRRKLALIDAGRMCIACEGIDMKVEGDAIRCCTCGQVVSLAALERTAVSSREIAQVTDPRPPKEHL